jgi:hypothetical protein
MTEHSFPTTALPAAAMDTRVPTDSEIAAELWRQGLVLGDVEGLFR